MAFVVFSGGLKRSLLARTSQEAGLVRVGVAAPDFTLPDLDGRAVSLHEVAAQHDVTLVTFWATWCLPCRLEMPELVETWKKHRGNGLELLAVNTEQNPTKARAFAKERTLPFPVLLDDGSVQRRLGIEVLPTSLMVDRNATVLWAQTGALSMLSTVTGFQLRRARERAKEASKAPKEPAPADRKAVPDRG